MRLDNIIATPNEKSSASLSPDNKVILSVKEGANFQDTHLITDAKNDQFLKYFADGIFTINYKKRKGIKFASPNLISGRKTVPEESIFSNSLSKFNFVEIDYKIQSSPNVKLSIDLFWYSNKSLIAKTNYELKDEDFSFQSIKKEMIDVPPLAEKMGVCVSVYGVGKVKISHLRIRRSMGRKTKPIQQKKLIVSAPSPDKVSVKTVKLNHDRSDNLSSHVNGKPKKKLELQKVASKTHIGVKPVSDTQIKLSESHTDEIKKANIASVTLPAQTRPVRKKLNRIKVHPLLSEISQDSDSFLQDAVLYGIATFPALANDPYKMMTSLIKVRREHAVLGIIKKYHESFGAQAHQIHVNALYALFMMSELVDYYEALPFSLQNAPFFIQRYYIALAWTYQNETLYELMSEHLHYPKLHRPLLKNFIRYAEVFSTNELKALTQIILNNDTRHIEYFSLLSFYDLLIQRDLLDTAQLLTLLIQSKAAERKREGRINYNLLLSNIAFRCENYTNQLHHLNITLQQSRLLPLKLINADLPVSADNVMYEKDELYESLVKGDGPLVTVIMTTWNSVDTLNYAVQSILDQTHKNLELIIVDDASSDNTANAIKALAKKDKRIIPVLLKDNGGTYVAKNHGRAIARGEFVTCQDSDDWAHPQKIARLVEALIEDEDLIGVECGHIRISRQDGIQRRVQGYLKPDASSFMYRRAIVDHSVGFYDSVRAGADGEFKLRLIRYFGMSAFKFQKELLSIVEWAAGTLSGQGRFLNLACFLQLG